MSELTNFVEDFLLNPAGFKTSNIDADENQGSIALSLSNKISGEGGVSTVSNNFSTLRLQNTDPLSLKNAKYRVAKTYRKKVENSTDAIKHDPELAKYFLFGEESVNLDEDTTINSGEEVEESAEQFSCLGEELEEYSNESETNLDTGSENEAEYNESKSDSDTDSKEFDSDNREVDKFRTFNEDQSDQFLKSLAVKNQCRIFDSSFEMRISFQKMLSISNQMPQYDTYNKFVNNANYSQYKNNLVLAKKSVKNLVEKLLLLQEIMLFKNAETKNLNDSDATELKSDENSKKRKLNEFQNTLNKRQKLLKPFVNVTLNKWHEKCALLSSQNRGSNFSSFDVNPMQQIENLLINKDQLIRKTQIMNASRGNVCHILGKDDNNATVEHDCEIFDDSDFYSKLLEDLLKSKMSISNDMTQVSRRWIQIQKLRKKAKKSVDTKASKGRKIRYVTMSKLQQFMAPCKHAQMADEAANRLFSSLFGQSNVASVQHEIS